MTLSLIVAAARNGVIGRDNQLPWHLPDDLRRFKALTLGKPIVMGRKTHDSIGRPLPGRSNIVVSRQAGFAIEGCTVVATLAAAQQAAAASASPDGEVMIIGGAAIFREALPLAQRIYLTRVHAVVDGDIFLPAIDPALWRETSVMVHPADEHHAYSFSYIDLISTRI